MLSTVQSACIYAPSCKLEQLEVLLDKKDISSRRDILNHEPYIGMGLRTLSMENS